MTSMEPPVYDRPNSAAQLRATFASLLANGIVSTRTSSMAPEIGFIVNPSEGMTISVNKGTCWINGSCGMEDSRRNFTLDAGTSQPRIDIIVLRWDNRQAARNIDVFVKKVLQVGTQLRHHYSVIHQYTSYA